MKQKDRVRIVREAGYKGYDKSLDSKCENPQKYGVRRLDEAQAAIEAVATAPEGVLTGRQGKRTGDRQQALCTHFSPAAGGAPGADTGGSYHMWIWHGAALA